MEGSTVECHYGDFELFRRVAGEARPYWPHIGAIFVLGLLSIPVLLLAPVALKVAVDNVIGSHPVPAILDALLPAAMTGSDTALLLVAAGILVSAAVLGHVLEISRTVLSTYAGEKLVLSLRARLFRHMQRLSLSYHDRKGAMDSIYRIEADAWAVRNLMLRGLAPLVTAAATIIGMLYVTVRIDWQLALVAFGVSPVLGAVAWIYRRRLRAHSRDVKRLESGALSVVQEVLSSVRLVKAFGQEEREHERFLQRSSEGIGARLRLAVSSGTFGGLIGILSALGAAAVLVVGVRHVKSGVITLGELLLVMAYLSQLYTPLKSTFKAAADLQYALASSERIFSVLDESPDVPERPNARSLSRASGHVAFHDVSFSYEGRRTAVDDLSFEVHPGERVGIAGPTGAGKSTLVSLLIRFYDPDSGTILLDGVDLRDYKVADLRNQFAIVLQEPVLFPTSIAENIAYSCPDAQFSDIETAAIAANAHSFITSLPEGYETLVGERGLALSGGERQRISLARAFLKDAPIMVLDEPTSSVDLETEAEILEGIDRLARARTTFIIAHRASTLQSCDVHLQIDDGHLVGASAARLAPA